MATNWGAGDNSVDADSKVCQSCTFRNSSSALACSVCRHLLVDVHDTAKSRWICMRCTYRNHEANDICEVCEGKRDREMSTPVSEIEQRKSIQSSSLTPKRPAFNRQQSSLTEETRVIQQQRLTIRVTDVIKFCSDTNTEFEDKDFPAVDSSLITDADKSNGVSFKGNKEIVFWARPSRVRTRTKDNGYRWTLFNEPKSTDIIQGVLGNCWFASALSVLAERRPLLERIFITKEVNSSGVYAMRLCKDGQWVDVLVDDRLPCLADGRLAFCKAKRKQLWVPLLEKAMAKVYGRYAALTSGTTQEGLATLTGFPCESIEFDSLNKKNRLQNTEDGLNLLWVKLLSSIESKLLLGCSSGSKNVHPEEMKSVGLVSNHAYSILDVQLVHGEKLLRLRNTWGEHSWTGNWSEHSHCWDVVPAKVKAKLSTRGAEEGLFWISFSDFLKYFGGVQICFVREGCQETRLTSKFPNAHDSVLNMSRLSVSERTIVDFSLHQQSTRGKVTSDLVDILLVVYDDQWKLITHARRSIRNHITCSAFLEPGHYNIYCLSFTQWLTSEHREYVVVCHSYQPVYMEQVSLPKTVISDVLLHLVLAEGDPSLCDDTGMMTKYNLDRGWAGQIVVAVNNHPCRFLHIKCDWSDSSNLVFTRDLTTMDIIPPKHRQVINILTQLEKSAPLSLRCKQKYVGYRYPHPQSLGYKTDHTPAITHELEAIHRLMSNDMP